MVIEFIQPYIELYPRLTLLGFAALISLFITIVNYFILDKEKMREIKAKQKELQKQMKEHQKAGNTEKMLELNKEFMSHTLETFKHSFKPMIITIIPILIFFGFIKNAYATTEIAKTWFWYYLGGALVSSLVFRKLFNLP